MRILSRFGYAPVAILAAITLIVWAFWGFFWLLFLLFLGVCFIYRNTAGKVVCTDDKAILAPICGTITKINRVQHEQMGDCFELKIENALHNEGVIRANSKMSVESVKFRHGFFGMQGVEFSAFEGENLGENSKSVLIKSENLGENRLNLKRKSEILGENRLNLKRKNEILGEKHANLKRKNSSENLDETHSNLKRESENLHEFRLNENEKAMLNERVFITAKNGRKKFALRISAGCLERQIKLCEGLGLLNAGDELGFSLNSSVSLFLPHDTRILVNAGDFVKPCELLGYFA